MRKEQKLFLKRHTVILTLLLLLLSFITLSAKEQEPASSFQLARNPILEDMQFTSNFLDVGEKPWGDWNSFHLAKRGKKWTDLSYANDTWKHKVQILPTKNMDISKKEMPSVHEPFHLIGQRRVNQKTEFDLIPKNNPFQIKDRIFTAEQDKTINLGKVLYASSLISVLALNIADYFSTKEAMKHERLAEINPLVKAYSKNSVLHVTVKLGWTIGNYYLMKKLFKKNKKMAWVVSAISNLVMSYIVANNFRLIRKVK